VKTLILLAAVLLAGCNGCAHPTVTPLTTPPMTPDAGLSGCQALCANLAAIQCPEGAVPHDCVAACTETQTTQLVSLNVPCGIAAKTPLAMQACGIRCAK